MYMGKTKGRFGFTLVETLVALVIISTVFASVWTWFGAATISTNKITQAVELPFVVKQFLEHLEQLSLKNTSQGTFTINEYKVQWQSNVVRHTNQEYFHRQQKWLNALYNVNFSIVKNGVVILQSSTQQFQYWKNPSYEPPPPF